MNTVLPDPVGAAMSVWRPALITGHASACAGVGEAKLSANQLATAGWNRVSTTPGGRGAAERFPAAEPAPTEAVGHVPEADAPAVAAPVHFPEDDGQPTEAIDSLADGDAQFTSG